MSHELDGRYGTSKRRARLAGALLIVGTIIFWIGSAMPNSVVYMTPGLLEKIELIASHRTSWVLQHIFFLAGVTATAIGLVILATILRETNTRRLATGGLIGILLATVVWTVAPYFRLSVPAEEIPRTSDVPPLSLAAFSGWMFVAFTVLTLGALIVHGAALFQSGLLKRLRGVAAILSSLMLLAVIILGDWWPEIQYFVTSLIGIGLLRRQSASGETGNVGQGDLAKHSSAD